MELNKLVYHKTRIPELLYAKISAGYWSVFDMQSGEYTRVGPHYASKAELLEDFDRYSKTWGY